MPEPSPGGGARLCGAPPPPRSQWTLVSPLVDTFPFGGLGDRARMGAPERCRRMHKMFSCSGQILADSFLFRPAS